MENVKKKKMPFRLEDTMLMGIMRGSLVLQKMHGVCSKWADAHIPILPFIADAFEGVKKKIFLNLSFTWKIEC